MSYKKEQDKLQMLWSEFMSDEEDDPFQASSSDEYNTEQNEPSTSSKRQKSSVPKKTNKIHLVSEYISY